MKTKDLTNLLKNKSKNVKIEDNTDYILNNFQNYQDNEVVSFEKKSIKKPVLISSFSLLAVGLATMVILLIALNDNTGSSTTPTPIDKLEKEELLLSEELFALGNAMSESNILLSNHTEEEFEVAAHEVNDYLLVGDGLLSGGIKTYKYKNNDPKYNYEYKLNVSYSDSKNYSVNYYAYYNEVKDDDEYKINGVFVIDELSYSLNGEAEYDEDGDAELTIDIHFSEKTYLSINNEIETDEADFEYKYIKDGKEIKRVRISYENKNEKKEYKIEIKEKNNGVENEIKCEFKFYNETIECKYKNGDHDDFKMLIYIFNDYYLYSFENSDFTVKIKK